MRWHRKKANLIALIFFELCSLLVFILDVLKNKETRWELRDRPVIFFNKSTVAIKLDDDVKGEIKNNEGGTLQTGNREIVYQQHISECSCLRNFMYPPTFPSNPTEFGFASFNSSCSDKGTFYQKNQKVVTFSLYITNATLHLRERYEIGVIANLHTMRKYYPGYSLRIYTNFALTSKYCNILCANKDLFWCNVEFTPSHGNLSQTVPRTWRFLTLGDPTVDIFLSRDVDSLIMGREADVVKDWLSKGDKAISLMRDRPYFHNIPMLAGMWGASNNMLGMDNAANLREKIIEQSSWPNETEKRSDQKILYRTIFTLERENIVAYDSYNCVKWAKFTLVRPSPTRRGDPRNDFVANAVDFETTDQRRNFTAYKCPVACRSTYGQDWSYC